ncbi:MAG: hypothetical protein Q8R69_11740 [Telluria sp.]|nr:hypothetical protein [Telluria sp.]
MAPELNDATLQAICDILADTQTGLSGSEIGRYLQLCSIADPMPTGTKRHRLFQALREKQVQDRCGNHMLRFIMEVMKPVRFVGGHARFEEERGKLNAVLCFAGYEMGTDGNLTIVQSTKTLSEAEARAGTFVTHRSILGSWVHPIRG